MTETYEFRLFEADAKKHLPRGAGEQVGIVRRIVTESSTPLFGALARADQALRHKGGVLTAWKVRRKYSKSEIASAQFFLARIKKVFEPAGEECGTVYDESTACWICRVGATQVGPLKMDRGRFPKNADVARTIAGEVVVTQAVVDLANRHALKGAHFAPVSFTKRAPGSPRYQLQARPMADIDPLTHVGRTPFEDGAPEEICPRGHLLGLNRLSELILSGAPTAGADIS